MNAFIDQDGCIACGQCYDVCPEVFSAGDNGIAFVAQEQVPKDQEETRPHCGARLPGPR